MARFLSKKNRRKDGDEGLAQEGARLHILVPIQCTMLVVPTISPNGSYEAVCVHNKYQVKISTARSLNANDAKNTFATCDSKSLLKNIT